MRGSRVRARSMLFTLFGDYVRHYGGTIWIGSLIALFAQLGFTPPAVRAAVSRMARQGWLTAIRAGRASYYALTPRGQDRIEEAARRIFKLHPEPWDGLWRLLVVPPSGPGRGAGAGGRPSARGRAARAPSARRRAGLRRDLEWMGFAPLARGVFISPNDLLGGAVALAERSGLHGLEPFTARPEAASAPADLAARCWDLRAIDAAYAGFVAEWKPRLERYRRTPGAAPASPGGPASSGGPPAEGLSDAAAFAEKTRLVHEFRKFLFIDPGLPADLLSERWSGTEARGVFSAYYHLLAEGALRFFEANYRPAPGHEGDVPEGRRAARRDPFRPARPATESLV